MRSEGKMQNAFNLSETAEKIAAMKKIAKELQQLGSEFPALARNTARILSGIRMLEINISDLADLGREQ
jgi:hypothetical protein